jgi:stalled ribosome rescue protein Dom34
MNAQVGLWIDHRKAVIVFIDGEDERVELIESNTEKRARPSYATRSKATNVTQDVKAEDIRDRKDENHLGKYYDEVIAHIRGAESILILGPGEAKGELQQHIKGKELRDRILHVETTDKLTERQIIAKARKYFTSVAKHRRNPRGAKSTVAVKKL